MSIPGVPGGHIEFGEKGREALVREMKEETGLDAKCGRFMGVIENSFMQHGKPHAEINLVYEMEVGSPDVASQEDWIGFEWVALDRLGEAKLLPESFQSLSAWPSVSFEP